jgi:type IV secretory pathway TrbD component
MVRLMAACVGGASVLVAVYSPFWGWIGVGLAAFALLVILWMTKRRRFRPLCRLSPEATAMARKFGHAYVRPAAARDLSLAASTILCASFLVGVVGLWHGFWRGVFLAVVSGAFMGWAARSFDPQHFLVNDRERSAHAEILAAMRKAQTEERR